MVVPEWIPFAVGAVIMLWALWSASVAFTGSQGAGLPLIVTPEERDEAAEEADRLAREERRMRRNFALAQISNFILAFVILGAAVGMIVAAVVIGH